MAAQQLDAAHAVAEIHTLDDTRLFQFRVETGPAATRIELAARIEQRISTADTMVVAPVPTLIVFTTEWRFGAGTAGDPVLFIRQLRFPLFVWLANFAHVEIVIQSTRLA